MSVGEQRVEQRVEQHVEQPVIQPATETAVKIVELGSIPNFDCAGDATSLGTRWNKCIRSFKFFLAAKGIINRKQNYDAALEALNAYFKPSFNSPSPKVE